MQVKTTLIFFLIIFYTYPAVSQSKLEKWSKKDIAYQRLSSDEERVYTFSGENTGEVLSKSLINIYWFFISDVDGANCPFYPSCSSFFIKSVKETNLLQGSLMFADRFTRDLNFVNRSGKYPRHSSGRYFDPASLYTLN